MTGAMLATELLKLPLIVPSYPNPLRGNIEVLAKKYNITLNICVELDSMSIIKDLVRRGSGYAHLTNEIEHNILKIMPIESPDFWRNVCLFGLLQDDGVQPSSIAINFIEKLILDTVEADLWPGARPIKKNKKILL
jgi:LysR family nitrogen assimilation transcriptional regulator